MTTRIGRFLAARLNRKSDLGLRLTVAVVLFGAAVWVFGGVLDAVLDNETLVRMDLAVNSWFHAHATPSGLTTFNAITMIGSPGVWIIATVVAIWLFAHGHRFLAFAWAAINAGGGIVQFVLKTTVHRNRPQYAAAYLHGHSYSFPSGHTMGSTICFLVLAFVFGTLWQWPLRKRCVAYAGMFVLIAAIGFSRLYLGVHYPTDVVGGFAAGIAWVAASIGSLNLVRHRWIVGEAPEPRV